MKHAIVFIIALAIGVYVGARYPIPVIGKASGG